MRLHRLSAAALLLLLMASSLHAFSYRVEGGEGKAILHARRIDAEAEPVRREVAVPSQGTIDTAAGTWELALESDDVWAAPVFVQADAVATIATLPAAKLRARLGGEHDELPPDVTVFVTPAEQAFSGGTLRAMSKCPVVEREIRCVVTAGVHDVRIIATGFVPQFRWDVDLPVRAVTKLDPIPLIKGAAVIGRVEQAGRAKKLPKEARVTLAAAIGQFSLQTRPNAKGFFLFTGVPPGEYVVTGAAPSLTSDVRKVVVIANKTAELRAPLVLDEPKRVRATIFPALDPDGKPWLVELATKRIGERYLDIVGNHSADPDGMWEQKNLRDGEYHISVMRRDGGGQWASETFDVEGADVDLPVSVPVVQVEGTVSFGDQPIAARLHFGGEYGAVRQLLRAGEEGRFTGALPVQEEWDILIEADAPPVRRTLPKVRGREDVDGRLHFDLVLPRTVVLGTVSDPDGKPAKHAIVTVQDPDLGRIDDVDSDATGSFQLTGLAPGRGYRIKAEDFLMESDIVEFEVPEDPDAEIPALHLVMKKVTQFRGRVVADGKVPVIGARVSATPVDVPAMFVISEHSNETGAFTLLVPNGVTMLDVFVAPPGFAAILARVPVQPDRMMEVTVDQHGGSLTAEAPAGATVQLTHGGAKTWIVSAAQKTGGLVTAEGSRQRITIPSLQAGQYGICIADRCESGYLPPHGTLKLSLK